MKKAEDAEAPKVHPEMPLLVWRESVSSPFGIFGGSGRVGHVGLVKHGTVIHTPRHSLEEVMPQSVCPGTEGSQHPGPSEPQEHRACSPQSAHTGRACPSLPPGHQHVQWRCLGTPRVECGCPVVC